jgi:uncharacterized MAPEG superfamily protein
MWTSEPSPTHSSIGDSFPQRLRQGSSPVNNCASDQFFSPMTTAHFTVAYWCVLIAALLPLVCAGIAKSGSFGKPLSQGGFDNDNPRQWLAKLSDWRARANAAQANSFEALPFFIGAVVIAHQLGALQGRVDLLALVYIVLRLLYITFYVGGLSTLRSLAWACGLLVNVAILFAGYR